MSNKNVVQIYLVNWLLKLKKEEPSFLRQLIELCESSDNIKTDWRGLMEIVSYEIPDELLAHVDDNFYNLVLQQINMSEDEIEILPPGTPLRHSPTINFDMWKRKAHGTGKNLLRCKYSAHPRALAEGDVLITGQKVASAPRHGDGEYILVHISTEDSEETWVIVPSMFPLALLYEPME